MNSKHGVKYFIKIAAEFLMMGELGFLCLSSGASAVDVNPQSKYKSYEGMQADRIIRTHFTNGA